MANQLWVGNERIYRIVAEKAMGKALPESAVIHHVDGNRGNNNPDNLVICQDHSYHQLIHMRERALNMCGNPDYRRCNRCGEYDHPDNMRKYERKGLSTYRYQHRAKSGVCIL